MIEVSTSLQFRGDCEAAFRFYERCLGARIEFSLTWGESPMAGQAPPEWRDKILHMRLRIGNETLSGGDVRSDGEVRPQGFSLLIGLDSVEEADRVFTALAEGGTIAVPLQETFWSPRFGALADRFGIPWEVHCESGRAG
jgi:PhnB protein